MGRFECYILSLKGTTWVQEIVWQILADFSEIVCRNPWQWNAEYSSRNPEFYRLKLGPESKFL